MFLEAETRFVAHDEWSGAITDDTHYNHSGKTTQIHHSRTLLHTTTAAQLLKN